jgi:hypothetical protein
MKASREALLSFCFSTNSRHVMPWKVIQGMFVAKVDAVEFRLRQVGLAKSGRVSHPHC